ncbi:hypothetical protein AB1Y20_001321 [Prymnesium parvum]|uniref:Mannosyltransferase n=1 Tax=Prymnesium parvum TaxID=97485 RepID=A0AB34KC79_PRYPA
MAVRGCPFEVPSDPAALQGAPPTRPPNLPAWGGENVTSLTYYHRIHFSPTNYSADGWKSAIIASQHPLHCERFLLVEDDMNNSGIGFTAKVWSFALLLAVRTRRVLLEVPRASGRSRWCDRPPYSFQCLYEPWTHCSPPPANVTAFVPKVPIPTQELASANRRLRNAEGWAAEQKIFQHPHPPLG